VIVTSTAATEDLTVIDDVGRFPSIGAVAVFTKAAAIDVCWWLPTCVSIVMAVLAIACDTFVREMRW